MSEVKTIEIWKDSLSAPRPCNGPTCQDQIVWATVIKSGAKMCFTHPTEPVNEGTHHTGRAVLAMPFDRNHWATCPDRKKFGGARRGGKSQ